MNQTPDQSTMLEAVRQAIKATSPNIDVANVKPETPLAVLFFDSIRAVAFIARLEEDLKLGELPFENWLQSYAERTEELTIGALIDWVISFCSGDPSDPSGSDPSY